MKTPSLSLTLLGSGTSSGVPLIGCECQVCQSKHSKNKRLRASALLQINQKNFLIDTSTDLRQQALTFKINRVDAVLYTHPHADHTHGIDELRSYNFIQKEIIPIFGNAWTEREIHQKFTYAFNEKNKVGGGSPCLQFHLIETKSPFIDVLGEKIIPISLEHGKEECVGYRIGSLAYITDCQVIPPASLERLKKLDILVLDCVRIAPHATHLNLENALSIISKLKPKKTFLTHLGHEMDYVYWSKNLPKKVYLAYDGLKISIA